MNKLVVTEQLKDSSSLGSRASHQSFLKSPSHNELEKGDKRFLQRVNRALRMPPKLCKLAKITYCPFTAFSIKTDLYIHFVWTLKSTAARDRMSAGGVKWKVAGPSIKFLSSQDEKKPEDADHIYGLVQGKHICKAV